jgi:hypothetical protein
MLIFINFISNFPIELCYVNCLNKRKSINQKKEGVANYEKNLR